MIHQKNLPCPEALRLWRYSLVIFAAGKPRENVFFPIKLSLENDRKCWL